MHSKPRVMTSRRFKLPDLEQTNTTWSELLAASIAPVVSTVEGLMDPETWQFLKTFTEEFRTEGPIDVVIGDVGRLGRAWSEFLAQYPLIVTLLSCPSQLVPTVLTPLEGRLRSRWSISR